MREWLFVLSVVLVSCIQPKLTLSAESANDSIPEFGPTDPREMAAFLTPIILEEMKKEHVPGVTFVFVKDGRVFLKSGYGYSDLDAKKPVDADKTIFRVASVSKVITVTAVMQLYDRGQLDLNMDLNHYLKRFQIPATFPEPITVAHLITHTAGFDDTRIGLATLERDQQQELGTFLSANLPDRVRPVGQEYSYSRYGIALAGYIVECVSGMPFADYVQQNILAPLGMSCSGFRFPDSLVQDLSNGYEYSRGDYHIVPYYFFNTEPEASFNTTAGDMTKFMLAHLQQGRLDNVQLLTSETTQMMHAQHFTHDPALPGIAYGFYERTEHGLRSIQHGGHIPAFVSRILLFPNLNCGFFMACNNDRFGLISEVTERILTRYFMAEKQSSTRGRGFIESDLRPFTGWYQVNDYSRNTVEKVFSIRKQFKVSTSPDGLLVVKGKHTWGQIAPLQFQHTETGEYSVFQQDKNGKISAWFDDRFAYEKLPFDQTLLFTGAAVAALGCLFVSGLLFWPGLRRRNIPEFDSAAQPVFSYRIAGITSCLNLAFLVGFGLFFVFYDRINEFTFGVPFELRALLCLPVLSAITTVVLVVLTPVVWRQNIRIFEKFHYTLLSAAAVFFLFFLNSWNLIGFRF